MADRDTLEGVYTAIENVLREILGVTDGGVLSPPQSYHAQLLAQAAQKADTREPVVGNGLYRKLDELRGFRHRERTLYRHVLREELVDKNMTLLKDAFSEFERTVNEFFKSWERSADFDQKQRPPENKLRTTPDDAERARKGALAKRIVAIAKRRKLEMPNDVEEKLAIYAEESELRSMLKDAEMAPSFRDLLDAL